MDQFDQAFDQFLESHQADLLFNDYFLALRQAFAAGYRCAGGELPQRQPVIFLSPSCWEGKSPQQHGEGRESR